MEKEKRKNKVHKVRLNVSIHVCWPNDIESQSQTMINQKWDEDWKSNNKQNIFWHFQY